MQEHHYGSIAKTFAGMPRQKGCADSSTGSHNNSFLLTRGVTAMYIEAQIGVATVPRLCSVNWRNILQAVLIILLGAAGVGLLELYSTVQSMREEQKNHVLPALAEIPNIAKTMTEIETSDRQLPEIQKEVAGTRTDLSGLKNNVTAVRRELNEEVIPWINNVKKNGPQIQPAQVESLYKQQQELAAAIVKLQKSDEGKPSVREQLRVAQENEEKHASQLQGQLIAVRES